MSVDGGDQAHVGAVTGEEGGVEGGDVWRGEDVVSACASLHPINPCLVGEGAWGVCQVKILKKCRAPQRVVQRGGVAERVTIEISTHDGGLGAQQGDELLNRLEHALFLSEAVVGPEVYGDQEESTIPGGLNHHRKPVSAVHGYVGGGGSLIQSPSPKYQEPRTRPLRAADDIAITPGDAVA